MEKTIVNDIDVEISVVLGEVERSVKEILSLGEGSIIDLQRATGSPVIMKANGVPVAEGSISVIDDKFAIKITKVLEKK